VRAGAAPVFLYLQDFNDFVTGNRDGIEMFLCVLTGIARPYYR